MEGVNQPANRRKSGQFAKGCSGNPSGRPKRSEAEREAIQKLSEVTPEAVEVLLKLMRGAKTPAQVRLRCCEVILERVCGKPMTRDEIESMSFNAHNIRDYMRGKADEPIY